MQAVYAVKGIYDLEKKRKEIKNIGFFEKMMGIKKGRIDDFEEFISVTDPKLQELKTLFVDYIKEKAPVPWNATKYILDSYLSLKTIPEFVFQCAKDENGEGKQWFLGVVFNGCAGMAEVSSLILLHWFDLFFTEKKDMLKKELLEPMGFQADESLMEVNSSMLFLPLFSEGYARFIGERNPKAAVEGDDSVFICSHFDLDETVYHHFGEGPLLERVDKLGFDLMKDRMCKCQLCCPDFDLEKVNDLKSE